MDNLLTDQGSGDIQPGPTALRGEVEIERTLGALRVRVSTCPCLPGLVRALLIRLERWRPGMYSTQYLDSAEALREEIADER